MSIIVSATKNCDVNLHTENANWGEKSSQFVAIVAKSYVIINETPFLQCTTLFLLVRDLFLYIESI